MQPKCVWKTSKKIYTKFIWSIFHYNPLHPFGLYSNGPLSVFSQNECEFTTWRDFSFSSKLSVPLGLFIVISDTSNVFNCPTTICHTAMKKNQIYLLKYTRWLQLTENGFEGIQIWCRTESFFFDELVRVWTMARRNYIMYTGASLSYVNIHSFPRTYGVKRGMRRSKMFRVVNSQWPVYVSKLWSHCKKYDVLFWRYYITLKSYR